MQNSMLDNQSTKKAGAQNDSLLDGGGVQGNGLLDPEPAPPGPQPLNAAKAASAVSYYVTNAARYPQDVIDQLRGKVSGVPATGPADTALVQAIAAYQQSNKLDVDGKAGPGTLTHMFGSDIRAKAATETDPSKEGDPRGKLSALHPLMQTKAQALLANAKAKGLSVWVVDGLRTIAEQDALYAKGRTAPGSKVTNVKGGGSYHNYGVAIDVVFTGPQPWGEQHDWKALGQAGVEAGLEWGGNWTSFIDRPHFQIAGLSTALLRSWHAAGGMQNVWAKVSEGGGVANAGGGTAAPAPAANFNVTRAVNYNRGRGYTKEQWKKIQEIIGSEPDGLPGQETARSIFAWQQSKNLQADGCLGPGTFAEMQKEGLT